MKPLLVLLVVFALSLFAFLSPVLGQEAVPLPEEKEALQTQLLGTWNGVRTRSTTSHEVNAALRVTIRSSNNGELEAEFELVGLGLKQKGPVRIEGNKILITYSGSPLSFVLEGKTLTSEVFFSTPPSGPKMPTRISLRKE